MSSRLARELSDLRPRLYRFALSLCGKADEAEDLVQSALERALRAEASFTPGTRLDAWVFRIIRNLWIDGIRRRRTEGVAVNAEDDDPQLVGEDGRTTVEATLTLAAVRAGMERLPPDQQRVLTVVCVEGASYREAADALGVPIGTVMSRLARARRALAEDLGMSPSDAGQSP